MSAVVARNTNTVRYRSADGTIKLRFFTPAGESYEACLLRLSYRSITNVICVSTQLGCPFDCMFCRVGAGRYERNLTKAEIIAQVMTVLREPAFNLRSQEFEIAAMGTGEPLCLLPELIAAVREIKSTTVNLVSLNVSTIGIPDRIREYAAHITEGVERNLQISLHGATDEVRSKIMPRAAKYKISTILSACAEFVRQQQKKVLINYLLLKGVNDSLRDAEQLGSLLDPALFSIKISILNPTPIVHSSLRASEKVVDFCDALQRSGLVARVFTSAGVDIDAGCGQFGNALSS